MNLSRPMPAWRSRVDPELAEVLAFLPDPDLSDPVRARQELLDLVAQAPTSVDASGLDIADHLVPEVGTAPPVPVRVYRPNDVDGLVAGMLWIHGGGFVLGSVDVEHAGCVQIASALKVVVISVDYRLAPEAPFPAGLDDCYSALCWASERAPDLGLDAGRLAVAGISAGGGLAAAVALRARDQAGPELAFQFLSIPELDDRLETPSMREFDDTPMWNRPAAEESWRLYLGEGTGEISPYAAPAREQNLAGLPPTYLCTAELDPLRDEGIEYAWRMIRAGVEVELHHFPGTFHGSQLVVGANVSRRMSDDMLAAFRRGLRLPVAGPA